MCAIFSSESGGGGRAGQLGGKAVPGSGEFLLAGVRQPMRAIFVTVVDALALW